MLVVFCDFQKKNNKVLNFHVDDLSFFEINTSLFKRELPISVAL